MSCNGAPGLLKGAVVKSAMQSDFGRPRRVSPLSAGLLLLWLTIHVLAALPQLHQDLHEDASSSGHQCLLTQFAGSCFEPPVPSTGCQSGSSTVDAWPATFDLTLPAEVFYLPSAPRPPPPFQPSFLQAGS